MAEINPWHPLAFIRCSCRREGACQNLAARKKTYAGSHFCRNCRPKGVPGQCAHPPPTAKVLCEGTECSRFARHLQHPDGEYYCRIHGTLPCEGFECLKMSQGKVRRDGGSYCKGCWSTKVNHKKQYENALPYSKKPLPEREQVHFSKYPQIHPAEEDRIDQIRAQGLASVNDEWIVQEKVHGANVGLYLIDGTDFKFAKRSGIMDPKERFFGYHALLSEFKYFVGRAHELLEQKLKPRRVNKVVLHGELFGCKYDHPNVPKNTTPVHLPNDPPVRLCDVPVQTDKFPQYSPNLHFYCFDVKYSVSGRAEDEKILTYDEMADLCKKIPGLLYATALFRGPLDQCLQFDVETFNTPLPEQFRLPPIRNNRAEGVVIRHKQRGTSDVDGKQCATILKNRCNAFLEARHPGQQRQLREQYMDKLREAAGVVEARNMTLFLIAKAAVLDAALKLLDNSICNRRLSNVRSKVGDAASSNDLVKLLAKDAFDDFFTQHNDARLRICVAPQVLEHHAIAMARKVVSSNR